MTTASRFKPTRPAHTYAPRPSAESMIAALPKPPAVCETLEGAVPSMLSEAGRIQYLYSQIQDLPEDTRLLLKLHIQQLAMHMIHAGASDMDAGGPAANESVWYRVDGVKKPCEELGSATKEQMDVLILSLLTDSQVQTLISNYSIDFSYSIEGEETNRPRRFRASVYFDEENLAINLRVVRDEIRPLDSLGFHPSVQNGLLFSTVRDGLTLIAGATGVGKTTTLDAIIDANNRSVHGHIVVIGDPIEYRHASNQCMVRHREVGRGVASYKDGIVQAMHQDPDMIVIGEMLDAGTISAALDATDSGHRVFSTIHSRSAVESIERIVAEYPAVEQERVRARLAEVLNCIVAQKLCPIKGGGRVLAKEVLWVTPAVKAAIKNNNLSEIYQMMWEGGQAGMQTLEQDLLRLYRKGMISADVAISYANNKKRMRQML